MNNQGEGHWKILSFHATQSYETPLTRYCHKIPRNYEKESLHASDAIVLITGDMEPSARVHKRRIPALEHVAWVGEALPQGVECVTLGVGGHQSQRKQSHHCEHRYCSGRDVSGDSHNALR